MKLIKFLSIPLIIVILITAYIILRADKQIKKVCFLQKCFEVELAVTPEARALGLMYREYLAPDKGMLFIFPDEAERGFWMKNTLIPLDIIWINQNKEIVYINKNTLPCEIEPCAVIKPDQPASYVLEINVGMADKINLKIGGKMILK